MVAIVKEMTVLAVHGDVVEENVQRIMDEKSARDPTINPAGIMPGKPTHNIQDLPHDTTNWPKAKCNGLIVAEDLSGGGEKARVEIPVLEFDQLDGVVQGGRVRVTIEPILG